MLYILLVGRLQNSLFDETVVRKTR